jgi:hypothetical protein
MSLPLKSGDAAVPILPARHGTSMALWPHRPGGQQHRTQDGIARGMADQPV